MNADFVMIVANLCGVKIEEVVVEKGSKQEKDLLNKACLSTFPILQVDEDTLISDSFAIAQFIARSSKNEKLLGSSDLEQCQTEQWAQFLREETYPIVMVL